MKIRHKITLLFTVLVTSTLPPMMPSLSQIRVGSPMPRPAVATPLDDRLLDDAEKRAQSFRDAIARLGIQAMQARAEELQSRFAALSAAEKDELRTLLRQVKGIPAPEP